jgi:hypothetical protein
VKAQEGLVIRVAIDLLFTTLELRTFSGFICWFSMIVMTFEMFSFMHPLGC